MTDVRAPSGNRWALGVLWVLTACVSLASELPVPAAMAPLAARSLLTDVAVAPSGALIAVGERGHVLVSHDGGQRWSQVEVPVDVLLTGACFLDDLHGVVVGHDETILATADGGSSWRIAHFAPESAQPFLDVSCGRDGAILAVGAYAGTAISNDAGRTFQLGELTAAPLQVARHPARMDDDAELEQPHLNAVSRAPSGQLYVAGEAGHLYRSDDAGAHWIALPSPYSGSFFAVLPIGDAVLIAAGLRGHIYRSTDRGLHWAAVESSTDVLLSGAAQLADGRIVIVGMAGVVLVSDDAGQSFRRLRMADRKGLSAVVSGPNGPVIVGENGLRRLQLENRK